MQELTLQVDGMKCDGCVAAVRGALESLEGVVEVDVSLADGTAKVHAGRAIDRGDLVDAVAGAGYRAT